MAEIFSTESILPERILLERRFGPVSPTDTRSLKRRRVYILPTRYGLLFGGMLMVMLLGAINYNNSLAYVLTFLLSSLTLIGIFFSYRNIAGLIITARKPEAVFAGEQAWFPVQFDNLNQLHRYSLSLINKDRSKKWYRPATATGKALVVDIEADRVSTIAIAKKSQHRGILDFGRLQIFTVFPLGLFKAWSTLDLNQSCLIYPAPAGRLVLPAQTVNDQVGIAGSKEGDDDFIGLRQYRIGDSSHQIDWKAYARERGLHRKLFQGQGSTQLTLHWSDVAHLPNTEERLSQLCQWILEADNKQIAYGLELIDVSFAVDHGFYHKQQCLTALAQFGL